jgi:hypothetical protein
VTSRHHAFHMGRCYLVPQGFKVDSVQNPADNKKKIVVAYPANLILVKQDQHEEDQEKVGFYDGISSALSGASFNFCAGSKLMLGFLFASHPTISAIAWEQAIVFILRAFFMTAGMGDHPGVSVSELQVICPGTTTIDNLVMDFAAHSQVMSSFSLDGSGKIFLAFDKGDGTKGGLYGCVRRPNSDCRLSRWSDHSGATRDADKTGDTSEDVAAGVCRSFQILRLRDGKQAAGSSWDSGGGGVSRRHSRWQIEGKELCLQGWNAC